MIDLFYMKWLKLVRCTVLWFSSFLCSATEVVFYEVTMSCFNGKWATYFHSKIPPHALFHSWQWVSLPIAYSTVTMGSVLHCYSVERCIARVTDRDVNIDTAYTYTLWLKKDSWGQDVLLIICHFYVRDSMWGKLSWSSLSRTPLGTSCPV